MNTFGFFIESGALSLAKNGVLTFIVPNTILTQDYYHGLRKFILEQTQVAEIVTYEKLPFDDAVVEAVTLFLQRTRPSSNAIKVTSFTSDYQWSSTTIPAGEFASDDLLRFSVAHDDAGRVLKKNIDDRSSIKLGQISSINQAIALKGDRAAHLFNKAKGKNYKPVIDGREIHRYGIAWSGNYLRYDVDSIHSCKREDIFLSKKKIFFRRVSSSLIAALDEEQFYALNTLVVINLNQDTNRTPEWLLALFNSKLWNYYYTTFLKSTKKVFSEIQARSIAQLPLPMANRSLDTQLEKLVEKRLGMVAGPKAEAVEREIDQVVYGLYGLTPEEIEIVERSGKRKPTNDGATGDE